MVVVRRTFFCIVVVSNTSLSSSSLSSSVFGTREKRPTKTVFSKNFTRATTVTVKLRAEYERKAAISERMSKKLLAVLRKVEDIANAHEEMKALMLRNTRDDDDDDENTTTNEDTTIERLLMEAELCQMLDRKRAEMERREKEFEMEERRHRDGVEAVLELKNKLKKEVDGAERNDDEEVLEFGDVVEEKDVLKAVSKKKEKSLDDFLNEKEEEEDEEDNDDDESSSTTTTTNAKAKTKYGKAALLKFEKRKKELLERQRLAYEKALKKKK